MRPKNGKVKIANTAPQRSITYLFLSLIRVMAAIVTSNIPATGGLKKKHKLVYNTDRNKYLRFLSKANLTAKYKDRTINRTKKFSFNPAEVITKQNGERKKRATMKFTI